MELYSCGNRIPPSPFRVFQHRHPECGWSACLPRKALLSLIFRCASCKGSLHYYLKRTFMCLFHLENWRYGSIRCGTKWIDGRREIGALGRFQAPYPPPPPPPPPNLFQISFGLTLLMKCLLITVMWKVLGCSGCSGVTHVPVHPNLIL